MVEVNASKASQSCDAAVCFEQNPENGGLVSADRQASWLSCLQHPVSLKSSTVDLLPRACLVALTCGAGQEPIVTLVTPGS